MAEKKKTTWDVNATNLTATFPDGTTTTFDMARIFPDYTTLSKSQGFVVQYGVKQFLSDKTARGTDEALDTAGKVIVMETRYEDLVNGEFRMAKGGGAEKIKKTDLLANLAAMSDEDLATLGMTRDAAMALVIAAMTKK